VTAPRLHAHRRAPAAIRYCVEALDDEVGVQRISIRPTA
jgi:hypothetical protein